MLFRSLYLSWLVTLFGAAVTAVLPDWRHGVSAAPNVPGQEFTDALSILVRLMQGRDGGNGEAVAMLARHARVDVAHAEMLLERMRGAGWVQRIVGGRWIIACDPARLRISDVCRALGYRMASNAHGSVATVAAALEGAHDRVLSMSLEEFVGGQVPQCKP